MRRHWVLMLAALLTPPSYAASNLAPGAPSQNRTVVSSVYSHLPLLFEANQGQASVDADFIARGPDYDLFLASKRITLALQNTVGKADRSMIREAVTMDILGSQGKAHLHGLDELASKTNYFIGSHSSAWQIGVRTYGKVKYEDVYTGVDLIFYGTRGNIEYDFVVHAGADLSKIQLSIQGEETSTLEEDGTLALNTRTGTVRFRTPVIYQETIEGRRHVQGRFVLSPSQSSGHAKILSFEVAAYDHTRPLIIDPILDYSTYLGGSGSDWAGGIAVDDRGNAYIVGTTASLDFPTTASSVFPTHGACNGSCYDAFVAKINTAGTGLVYATYLGGGGDDFGNAIAIDSSGNVYLTGATNSTDFPTTSGALQRSCGGTCFNNDAFVAKFNATGSALLYSTYLGGSNEDWGTGIAIHEENAYVSGFSASIDFPTTSGAFQRSLEGQGSSFVVQLNANGTALNFGTFLGEVDLFDAGGVIALDSAGNSYVAGNTLAPTFPLTVGAFHTGYLSGLSDNMYILKLNSTGSSLVYSALIGGAAPSGIGVDDAGTTYVAALAGPFSPVIPGAIDQSCDNGALVLKLSADGSNLLTAAHICPDRLWPAGVAFDSSQNIIFTGSTDSISLPTTVGTFQPSIRNVCCFSDALLGKLKADGSALMYLTYFGGNNADNANALATDSSGNIYVVGGTSSTNLPLKNAFQTANVGSGDAFLAKVTLPQQRISVSPATLSFPPQGIGVTNSPLQVTVANLSNSASPFSGVVVSGDFSAKSNCGVEVLAEAHCTIALEFKPTLAGNRTGALTITDGIGVQHVRLSGVGVSGPFVAFSSAYQINTAAGTTSPPFQVTVTNTGNTALNISEISLTNGPAFNFGGVNNCFQPIAPLATCTVGVTFNGQGGFGQQYTTLSLVDNAANSPQSFGLIGNVVGEGLAFTVPALRFGQQLVSTSSTPQQVALINGSGAEVTISSIKSSANFVQNHSCSVRLAAGAFCYIKVTFKPTSVGIKQGSITVVDSATGSPQVLPLLGTGN